MSYDIDVLVNVDRAVPSSEELKTYIQSIPMIEQGKPPRNYNWQYDYVNPDTNVSFSLRYQDPPKECVKNRAWDTGLQIVVPTSCPTFVARESFPVISQFTKKFNLWLYLPSGDLLEKCEASQLQLTWTDVNRKVVTRSLVQANISQPFYIPQDKLNEMWRYLSSRPELIKRYTPKIYVPRVILMRSKLSRKKIYRVASWENLGPSVIPDVDAFIISKPKSIRFGLFPSGERTTVFVHRDNIQDIIAPHLRKVERPIPHMVLEPNRMLKLSIYKALDQKLNYLLHDYETANIEEVVDITID